MSDAATTLNVLIAAGEADTIVVSEAAIPFLERRFEFVRGDRPAGGAPGAPPPPPPETPRVRPRGGGPGGVLGRGPGEHDTRGCTPPRGTRARPALGGC